MFDKAQIDLEIQKRKTKIEYYKALKKANNINNAKYQEGITNIQKKITNIENEKSDCLNMTKRYAGRLRSNNRMREKYVIEINKRLNGVHSRNALNKLKNTQNIFKRKIASSSESNAEYDKKIKRLNNEIVELKRKKESFG